MRWTGYHFCCGLKTNQSECACGVSQYSMPYLDERVDNSNIRTGVEHFVEVGLPVDKFQLVELLIVLQEKNTSVHTEAHSQHRQAQLFGTPSRTYFTVTNINPLHNSSSVSTVPHTDAPFWRAARKIAFFS